MPGNATVFWRKPSLPDHKANKKLQTPIKKWQAFDICNQSCTLFIVYILVLIAIAFAANFWNRTGSVCANLITRVASPWTFHNGMFSLCLS